MVACGPAMWPMRVWPSAARCSTARAAPRRSSGIDGQRPAAVDGAVHQDDREARGNGVRDDRVPALRRRDDEAVHLACDQGLEALALAGGLAVRGRDQRRVAGGVEHPLDPADDGREERVGEVGDEHADAERPPRLEATGDRVQRVAHLARDVLDAVGGGGIHQRPRARVEDARDGARMDARRAGDVAHRDLPLHHRLTLLSRDGPVDGHR